MGVVPGPQPSLIYTLEVYVQSKTIITLISISILPVVPVWSIPISPVLPTDRLLQKLQCLQDRKEKEGTSVPSLSMQEQGFIATAMRNITLVYAMTPLRWL